MRSSDFLYQWLTRHKILGKYINTYLKYRAVNVKSKIISLVILWTVMITTVIFFVSALWLRILLLLIACGVSIHLILLKNLTKEMLEQEENDEEIT